MWLIDADALIAYINDDIDHSKEMREEAKARNNEVEKSYNNGEIVEARRIKRYVNMSATTIDAVPVVHARWVESEFPEEKYCCSACGGACWYYDYEGEVAKSRYCPNCGAKMRGGTDAE